MPIVSDILASPSDDKCPVCGTTRYLQKNMEFLIADCYHKICNGCVERRFSSGPAVCPVAGCNRTLRRQRFHKPTFGDLQMEREVDIRKRLAKTFNRREDEFQDLKSYNDYLNDVEDITFNLINKIDLASTEAKIRKYQEQHDKEIMENIQSDLLDSQNEAARQAAEMEAARLRREALRREDEDERKEQEAARRNVIEQMASGDGNAIAIARDAERAILKKARARQSLLSQPEPVQNGQQFAIRGLKRKKQAETEAPFDPFGGMSENWEYYLQQPDYQWDYLDKAKTSLPIVAGGYDIQEFYSRALCGAFSGLGVFIGEEKAAKGAASAGVATAAAVNAGAADVKMADDVF